jgi:hypothetical protein
MIMAKQIDVRGHLFTDRDDVCKSGDYMFARSNVTGRVCNLLYVCPCGCGRFGGLEIDLKKDKKNPRQWKWSGSYRFPTLHPSIWSKKENGGCGYHGFLVNGIWTFC